MDLYKVEGIVHFPSLKTVLMVEEVLRGTHGKLNREELKEKLPKKIMHQTLNVVLSYLSERGLISDNRQGIEWIYNGHPNLRKNAHKHVVYAY